VMTVTVNFTRVSVQEIRRSREINKK
jgi:hypothetical protein